MPTTCSTKFINQLNIHGTNDGRLSKILIENFDPGGKWPNKLGMENEHGQKQLRICDPMDDSHYLWLNRDVPIDVAGDDAIIVGEEENAQLIASSLPIKKAKSEFAVATHFLALTHSTGEEIPIVIETRMIISELKLSNIYGVESIVEEKNEAFHRPLAFVLTSKTPKGSIPGAFHAKFIDQTLQGPPIQGARVDGICMTLQDQISHKHEEQRDDKLLKLVNRFGGGMSSFLNDNGNLAYKPFETGNILEQVKLMIAKVGEAAHRKAILEKSNLVLTLLLTPISVVLDKPPELLQKGLVREIMQWYIRRMMTWLATNAGIVFLRSLHDFSANAKQSYIVVLFYSAGSTVASKGVEFLHRNFIFVALMRKDQDLAQQMHNDFLCILTMFHESRLSSIVFAELQRGNIVVSMAKSHLGLILKGHFLLTNLLLDNMKNTARDCNKEGRIVNVSSLGHKFAYKGIEFNQISDKSSYNTFHSYGVSKLANILHAKELARRLKEEEVNITINSVHPGMVITNLSRHILPNYIHSIGQSIMKYFLKNVGQGAATQCYVALNPKVEGVSGEYFCDSNIAKPNAFGCDAELAKKLWEFSLTLTDPK